MSFFIPRTITPKLKAMATKFPVVALLGPRQSGKTTLLKKTFPSHPYVSLEDLDTRAFALEDPRGFLATYMKEGRIFLDEVQRVPALFSYIQTLVDASPTPGGVLLSGSHNFLLNQHLSQTLAGRIALLTLLPLSYQELSQSDKAPNALDNMLFQGLYPRIYAQEISPLDWYPGYISTFVERDVRQIINVLDLNTFRKFIKLCAGRVGQLLNLSSLGTECGISHNTAKGWLSLLEASYVIFLLHPYHKNFNKRLVKSPKIYFYDTGLVSSLLGIENEAQMASHYAKGGIFESFVISEFLKARFNLGMPPNCSFWRDSNGHEVDLLLEKTNKVTPIEIKSSQTFSNNFFDGLIRWNHISETTSDQNIVIYGGNDDQTRQKGKVVSWKNISWIDN